MIKQVGMAAAAVTTATMAKAKPAGANERLNVGVIGGSRGRADAEALIKNGVNIAYACDVDEARCARLKKIANADKAVSDFRRILDDKSIDAVVIAIPDHWHAPAAILACAADKHVYVEKPCSHNIREGRLMIEAGRRSNKVMQVGSQSRSTTVLREGVQRVLDGAIGEVLVAKAWNSQKRADIGHMKPSEPPAGFDYDMWVGPAPMRPFQKNCCHYTWHWWYDFGTGDAGNDGVHELDIATWGLGVETHPNSAVGHASKIFFDDDQQFPDTQYVTFEYAPSRSSGTPATRPKLLIYEHRIWSPYFQNGSENGNIFYGTEGYLELSKVDGWKRYGPKNQLMEAQSGHYSDEAHAADFLAAIKNGRKPNADIEIGHRSATLVHLANLLGRAKGQRIEFDPKTETVTNDPEANALLSRTYRDDHWAVPKGV